MAVRRPRRPRVPPKVAGTTHTTVGAVGGGDLAEAAKVILDQAERNAGGWSETVPFSGSLEVSGNIATITFDAPAAYPAETRARHPLFGDREHWYGPPGERFLGPAADARAGAAMARYARKIDRMCRARGFV